ncbi:phage baseplate assembly protein V [Rhodococcus aetherivorans]
MYPATVTDVADPDGQGRVRIRLPWTPDTDRDGYETWARLATLMAGAGRGTWFVPEVDDEVLAAFWAGDPDQPYVIGALWNGQDAPPRRWAPATIFARSTPATVSC